MSTWATRCNACGTSFRVSEEQLALSEGYARCGRCDAVFNARATLFDLDAPSAPAPLGAAVVASPPPSAPAPFVEVQPDPETAPFEASTPPMATPAAAEAFAPTHAAVDDRLDEAAQADVRAAHEPVWQPEAPSATVDPREPQWSAPDADRMLELLGAAAPAPAPAPAPAATFSSLQGRKPQRPASRWSLAAAGALASLLLLALPVHWAWIERDPLRARHAALDAWLDAHWPAARHPAGWRHLEGLSVSSSGLRATPQGGAYQLELVVHNRAPHALAMPWLDLSLSDSKGQLLLRRAIDPATLSGATLAQPLKVNEQRKLQAVFKLQGGAAVAGYEIGLFHP